ncbi:MAG TPA: DUF4286 family protein [Oligoflexia bacterium]|nr:DUF4286 family protein [Oligoflexia bacterium]HMR24497.1 DUF4286 family protein [Oligoflexia bacterium]
MYIYEVNLTIQKSIHAEFEQWLEQHIKDMLALPVFSSAQWYLDKSNGSSSEILWVIHYQLVDKQAYNLYLSEYAQKMRAEGIEKFTQEFTINRRYLVLKK